MERELRVGVVGCGTAGAATAIFLGRDGHRVEILEAVSEPRPVGAGIMVQPTGMDVLADLGLLTGILERGARVERLYARTTSHRTVLDLKYRDLAPLLFGLGLHRGALFSALTDAALATPSVRLRNGVKIDRLERLGPQSVLCTAEGKRYGPYDLVVVADGARSQLRDDTSLTVADDVYPWGAAWFIAEDPGGLFDGELYQVLESSREMLGFLPSGRETASETDRVSIFWSLQTAQVDAWRSRGLGAWRERILQMEPRAEPILDQITDLEELPFGVYRDVRMTTWNTDAVVYLGDAAHAMSPQLGQGANLALMDARALRDVLRRPGTVRDALQAYSETRRAHLDYYQWATRFLTPFFQSNRPQLAAVRDALMGLSCRLPYVRRRMLQTMCGLDRGILLNQPLRLPWVGRAGEKSDASPYR